MQSDVPPLPISYLSDHMRLRRSNNFKSSIATRKSSNNSLRQSKPNALLPSNKKKICSMIAEDSPYKNNRSRLNPPDTAKSSSKSVICKRVLSAKMLRIKQLQNQLSDAHFHLNELSKENKLLKTIQKRQDTALKRYEGRNAELPKIIHSHQEELRVLQTKFKKLKFQYKTTSDLLKDKENELYSLQVKNKKLMQLSNDRRLGEREQLQTQVLDLNVRIDQQDQIIQTLKRKLELETKYLKHQLHTERIKHKETQKQLQQTLFKLQSLEELTEQNEKKSYSVNRFTFFNKNKSNPTSLSLTNLNETRAENSIKGLSFNRRQSDAVIGHSLPVLNGPTPLTRSHSPENQKLLEESANPCETRINFEQIRRYRIDKSPNLHRPSFSTPRTSIRDSPIKESRLEEVDSTEGIIESKEKADELPKAPKERFRYSNDDDLDKINELISDKRRHSLNLSSGSRLLYARLINSANGVLRPSKKQIGNRSQSISKENTKNIEHDEDSVVTVISKDMLKDDLDTILCSASDLESEVDLPVQFDTDEDKNVVRKSDVALENFQMEKQKMSTSTASKLFTQFYPIFNDTFDAEKDNDDVKSNVNFGDESELKSTNSPFNNFDVFTNDDKSDNDSLTHTKFSRAKSLDSAPWNDNMIINSSTTKVKEKHPILEQMINIYEETDSRTKKERSFHNTEENRTEVSKETEKIVKSFNHNGKANDNNLKNPDLKTKPEKKTVENSKVFDKAKLLAAMKAIDDNENIEFIDQKIRRNSNANKIQATDNLYKGISSTHSRKKSDIMKELFTDIKLDTNKNGKKN